MEAEKVKVVPKLNRLKIVEVTVVERNSAAEVLEFGGAQHVVEAWHSWLEEGRTPFAEPVSAPSVAGAP